MSVYVQSPASGAPGPARQALGEAVKRTVLGGHEQLLAAMFGGLDTSEGLDADVRSRLRLGRPALESGYLRALARAFAPQSRNAGGSVDRELGRYSLSPSEALEEQLRLTALERAAVQRHSDLLAEIDEHLRRGLASGDLSINPSALGTMAALQAFRSGLEALDLGLKARLSLYGVFESAVLERLDGVYAATLALLRDQAGRAEPSGPAASAALADGSMLAALSASFQHAGQERDRRLAQALLERVERDAVGAIAQRLSLLGALIDRAGKGFVSDPSAKAWLDRLRWPLLKIALADGSVFEQASHPLRLALRDFRAAFASGTLAEIERRITQVEISADFVQPLLGRLPLLTPAQIGRFNDQLAEQERVQEEARLAAARRSVAAVLDRCTLGMVRPGGLRLFLRVGWGPLLTRRFLQQGAEAPVWQRGVRQLETLLAALANPATRVRDFEPHVNQAGAELFAEGLHADRVERLLLGLREAYDELHVGRVADAGAAAPVLAPMVSPGDGFIDFEAGELPLPRPEFLSPKPPAMDPGPTTTDLDLELRPV